MKNEKLLLEHLCILVKLLNTINKTEYKLTAELNTDLALTSDNFFSTMT